MPAPNISAEMFSRFAVIVAGMTVEDEVLAAQNARAAALANGDEAALRALMHPGLRWTTYRGEVLTYDTYIAGNTRGGLVWRGQRMEEVEISVSDSTAVLVGLVVDDVRQGGQDRTFRLRLTQTWVRTDEGWRCLAGHASVPA